MYSEKIMIQEAEKCSKCGACAGHCPVFKELQVETYSSRGKTEVAKALAEGKIPYSEYTEDLFSKCLLCLTCKANCPAGVDQSKLILGVRAELAKKRGLPFSKKMAFKYLMKNRALFGKALKAFSCLQKFTKTSGDGQLRHLPFFLSAFGKGRLIPDLSDKPLRQGIPGGHSPFQRADENAGGPLFRVLHRFRGPGNRAVPPARSRAPWGRSGLSPRSRPAAASRSSCPETWRTAWIF